MPAGGGEARRLTFHSARGRPQQLHGRRQGRSLHRGPPGHGGQRPVPHGHLPRALQRPGDRRRSGPGPDPAGDRGHGQPGRRQDHLPRPEGLRERLAQAPHLLGDPRHLGLRPESEEEHPADDVQGRGPQSGLRRQRRRLLLSERAERLVQRLQKLAEQAGRLDAGHGFHQESRPLPDPLDRGPALLRL